MKELFIILFVFVLINGGVYAEGNWGEINNREDFDSVEVLENKNISGDVLAGQRNTDGQDYEDEELQFSGDSEEYTRDFYIALGFGILGLLIAGLFIYLFMRGPKNKWKK